MTRPDASHISITPDVDGWVPMSQLLRLMQFAIDAGRQAHEQGYVLRDNPYNPGSNGALWWAYGWESVK